MYVLVFVAFQATFAAITCCLILGAFAERAKFSAVLLFIFLCFPFPYLPFSHMVWFWPGPDAYTAANVVDAQNAKAGLLWQWGALDFAGGTVVHINAGVAGLVGAYVCRRRIGCGQETIPPPSLPLTRLASPPLRPGRCRVPPASPPPPRRLASVAGRAGRGAVPVFAPAPHWASANVRWSDRAVVASRPQ